LARNYSTLEQLEQKEPSPLIPFTENKNVFIIKTPHKTLNSECAERNAQVLSFEPEQRPMLVSLIKNLNLSSVPFFGISFHKSLLSPSWNVLDNPESPEVKLKEIGRKFFAYLTENNTIQYPDSASDGNYTTDVLCVKSNNYWDRPQFRQTFVKRLNSIAKTFPEVRKIIKMSSSLVNTFNNLTKPNSPIVSNKYTFSIPPFLSKIQNFFQKFNNIRAWENSIPTDYIDFIDYINNFRKLKRIFKQKQTQLNDLSNFIPSQNVSFDLSYVDHPRLLDYLNLDSERYGIAGPARVRPLMSIPTDTSKLTSAGALANTEQTSTSIYADINIRIFDRQDLAKIFTVKPLIYGTKITTIKYLVGLVQHVQAMEEEPRPISCITEPNEEYKICEGFQSPGVEDLHQNNLLLCGRALQSLNDSIEIDKCPLITAPNEALVYRAECVPGQRSVVLSSARSMKVSVNCDTYTNPPSVFDNFPVIIETECGLKEIFPDSEKIILPQIHGDFYQPQKIGLVSVQAPPNITANSTPSLVLEPSIMILLATLGASVTSFSIFATVLAIFDPTRCMNITKTFCCCFMRLFYCCKHCCMGCCKCQPTESQFEMQNRNRYYGSKSSIPSAPPQELVEQNPFLRPKSPAPSARSSIHNIRLASSDRQKRTSTDVNSGRIFVR
jgi:hypothetical protein